MDLGYLVVAAIGLVFIIEGVFPLLMPKHYKQWLKTVTQMHPSQLRKMGLGLMLVGLVIFLLAHWLI